MVYKIIVATCNNNGIGINNKLPWSTIKEDMRMFSKLTIGNGNNAVIMGRKTYESIGKPLKNRMNIVLSNTLSINNNNVITFNNISNIINFCIKKDFEDVWIIGGEKIYSLFINLQIVKEIYQTKIYENYQCDSFFPEIKNKYNLKEIKKITNNPCCILIIWRETYITL